MQVRGYFGEGEIIAPPRASAVALAAGGFVVCPLAFQSLFLYDQRVQELYRWAYERARAAHRPSWYDALFRAPAN
jgi:hypothetical protein